jgi:hypothetical protein
MRTTKKGNTDIIIVYKQTLKDAKLKPEKRGKKTDLTGKSLLRRHRSALDRRKI